ncbi:MAG: peptidoglycan bridge formation glycyltransferase FemA/FemB family protein [Chloroflexi bacterium]|nr:peptidoglycan bridge formation glycyltransferase FemA/FemB family protein [Chloroflexota bacterium]
MSGAWQLVPDETQWQTSLAALPSPHVLQSWPWGEFKSRWGWTAQRWLLEDNGPACAMQVLRRSFGPLCMLYATKGPVARDVASYEHGLARLESLGHAQRAVWVKVDGDPPASHSAWTAADLDAMRAHLTQRHWHRSTEPVQFRNTMLTDLRADDEQLLARMSSKCRYNVRLAEKRGVQVRVIPMLEGADAEALYAMYAETGARDGFGIRERAYYLDAWRSMNAVGFIAEREGEALGGIVLFRHEHRAWYFYGMSRSIGREHMPNHLLQWQAMRWAREQGCDTYDWWGAPEQLVESDSMWGVYRFKQSFGAEFAEGIGAWDYTPSRLLFALYRRIRGKSRE